MIKRITFLICFSISICANAQTGCENQIIFAKERFQNLPKPAYILVIDTLKITPDSLLVAKLNPKWIKKIEVVKEIKYIDLYGNKGGLLFISIKKKYRNDVLTLLDKTSNK